MDFYLHVMEQGLHYTEPQAELIKDGLACLTLHLSSRPWNETVAWTLSWQAPLQNVFVTGSNLGGNVTGRLFTEDVRERDRHLFYAQMTVPDREPSQSMIEVTECNFIKVAEQYYRDSEQRMGRYFREENDSFVLVTAQPDCDLEWLESLDDAAIRVIDATETLSLLETRQFRFFCGCSDTKILSILAALSEETIMSLYGDAEVIPASCPRCGARYAITREALEAYLSERV
jgi:molecular chaperone Hsp33